MRSRSLEPSVEAWCVTRNDLRLFINELTIGPNTAQEVLDQRLYLWDCFYNLANYGRARGVEQDRYYFPLRQRVITDYRPVNASFPPPRVEIDPGVEQPSFSAGLLGRIANRLRSYNPAAASSSRSAPRQQP